MKAVYTKTQVKRVMHAAKLCRLYKMSLHSHKATLLQEMHRSFRFAGSAMIFSAFLPQSRSISEIMAFLRNMNDVIFFPPLGSLLIFCRRRILAG